MIPKSTAYLKTLVSVALSGAAGGLLDLYHEQFDWAHVDFHKMAQTAGGFAFVALLHYWLKSPLESK